MSGARQPRILLVDDRAENLFAFREVLLPTGAEIHEAASGPDALERVLANDYAVIILDVHMPVMDGFEAATLIRSRPRSRNTPILFVTAAAADAAGIYRGYGAGAVDFLLKPIDPDVLRSKVEVFLNLGRQRDELTDRVAERDRLVDDVQQVLRLNETLSAVLGHDLRNPLAAILNRARLLALDPEDPARTRDVALQIVSSAERMSRMVDELLDFSRARVGGGIPIVPREIDVVEVARRAVDEVRARAGARTIEFRASGNCRCQADPDRISQILSNLVSNALEHGDPASTIDVALEGEHPERIRLVVHNGGVIAPERLPHLFDPLRLRGALGHGAGRRGGRGGLGLGLFIVQQIVGAHGGRIGVSSSMADGTRFEVDLPRRIPPRRPQTGV